MEMEMELGWGGEAGKGGGEEVAPGLILTWSLAVLRRKHPCPFSREPKASHFGPLTFFRHRLPQSPPSLPCPPSPSPLLAYIRGTQR